MSEVQRTLYPEIQANQTGRLRVSDVHEIYWEESGNPSGKPVIFLHGGPGAGTEPAAVHQVMRYFFNRRVQRVDEEVRLDFAQGERRRH